MSMELTPETSWCCKGGARGYVTTAPVEWWIGKRNSMWLLTVPAGREFESSVPWCLNWLFSPDDPFFLKSAAIHDMLLEVRFSPGLCRQPVVRSRHVRARPRSANMGGLHRHAHKTLCPLGGSPKDAHS
jgi:hypothetical protein